MKYLKPVVTELVQKLNDIWQELQGVVLQHDSHADNKTNGKINDPIVDSFGILQKKINKIVEDLKSAAKQQR